MLAEELVRLVEGLEVGPDELVHLVPSPSVRAPLCPVEYVDGHVLDVFCSSLPCGIGGRARFGCFLFPTALRNGWTGTIWAFFVPLCPARWEEDALEGSFIRC